MLPGFDQYLFQFRRFTSSQYFYEGLRFTVAILVPVLVAHSIGQTAAGFAVGFGALAVGITDNPGPKHHRSNAMLITTAFLFFVTYITTAAMPYEWLLVTILALFSFGFAIVSAFGNRATNIGSAGLLIMVLSMDPSRNPEFAFTYAVLTAIGGLFYYVLSISAQQLMPYKLAQQVLGECLLETAHYLQAKAAFYPKGFDVEQASRNLAEAQITVNARQEAARELLFKTREFVRESTHQGRVLVMSFLETVDLFENATSTHFDYEKLHASFDTYEVLPKVEAAILQLAEDLKGLAIDFQAGRPSAKMAATMVALHQMEAAVKQAKNKSADTENPEAWLALQNITATIHEIAERIDTLHMYSTYHPSIKTNGEVQYQKFVDPTTVNLRILYNNLHFDSNVFRHAIRLAVSIVAAFFISHALGAGHYYWILLTVVVILKPAYSLTKQRNKERLLGTLLGVFISALAILFIKNDRALMAIVAVSMVITFSQIRHRYFTAVVFMTLYLVVALHLLNSAQTGSVFIDRVLDTLLGSIIAFAANILLPHKWEEEQIMPLLIDSTEASRKYFGYLSGLFFGKKSDVTQYKLLRKLNYVHLANANDAFRRMMNEPAKRRKQGELMHQLTVSLHMLTGSLATLNNYSQRLTDVTLGAGIANIVKKCDVKLAAAVAWLREDAEKREQFQHALEEIRIAEKLERENAEEAAGEEEMLLNQFKLINRTCTDILQVCKKLVATP